MSKLPDYYIAIGASAGGLEAIESFLSSMPENNNFGIIIIQHLSPDYKSMMAEILSKKTNIPVNKSENGMLVEANNIYLIPPKKILQIVDGRLVLTDPDYTGSINFPIDIFLRSLAEDKGDKSIAVILSGTGSDGVRGIRAIKQHGGFILVQDPESAKFDGMPKSAIATGLVDFILKPNEMPAKIMSIINYPINLIKVEQEKILTNEGLLNKILNLIKQNYNVDFTFYKPSTITRRLERRMSICHTENLADYFDYLYKNPAELGILFKEFLIGVTSFFRDIEIFKKLEIEIIPTLLDEVDENDLRVWVAGCSTGEEAYSLAIIFKEIFEKKNISKNLKIFATDIDKKALQFAALGAYPESITADVPVNYLSKYFIKQGSQFIINRNIRETIVFAEHNLIKDPPFTNISLVSCRNLLIYLKQETQTKVLKNFNFSLRKGGYLVLGTSETIGDTDDLFKVVDNKLKIYKSLGEPKFFSDYYTQSDNNKRSLIKIENPIDKIRTYSGIELDSILENAFSIISNLYSDAVLIVNNNLDILYMDGNLENYFSIPKGKPIIALDKITNKEVYVPLINGIKKSLKTNAKIKYRKILNRGRKKRTLTIDIIPFVNKKDFFALVIFNDSTFKKVKDSFETQSLEIPSVVEERIKDLENELQITKENLQATIEELETSNEELQATNEELIASNEELQATNEELQSTNEELHTVNTELQSKIFELTDLQNDMDNLLTSSSIGIIMLDKELKIKKYSPKITEIFKIIDVDIGRPITHISHYIVDIDPYTLFNEAVKNLKQNELEIKTKDNKSYLLRITPYNSEYMKNQGIVATFVEITHYRRLIDTINVKDHIIKATQKVAKVGGWYYDKINNSMFWTDEVYEIHGLDKKFFNTDPKMHIEKSLICYGEYAKEIIDAFNKCAEEGIPYDKVVPFKRYTGEEILIKTTGNPIYENNKIVGVVGTIVVLSENKKNN